MGFREIKKPLWLVLILNWLVATGKILVGILGGSISIFSDGIHSLFDGATNIVGIFGIRLAEKPADKEHPYGHRKYEAIASQIILFFLIITIWEIIKNIFERIFKPGVNVEINLFTFIVLFCCLAIDIFVAQYEYRKGKELKSTILKADARHTQSHYFTTAAIILSAILIKIGFSPLVDSLIALFVILFIVKLAES